MKVDVWYFICICIILTLLTFNSWFSYIFLHLTDQLPTHITCLTPNVFLSLKFQNLELSRKLLKKKTISLFTFESEFVLSWNGLQNKHILNSYILWKKKRKTNKSTYIYIYSTFNRRLVADYRSTKRLSSPTVNAGWTRTRFFALSATTVLSKTEHRNDHVLKSRFL